MRLEKTFSSLVFLCMASVSTGVLADEFHLSHVNFDSANNGAARGDVNGQPGFIAQEGQPLELDIHYEIGWYEPPEMGGPLALKSSDVKDPEYDLLVPTSSQYSSRMIDGLAFDKTTGVLSGTPAESGTFSYVAAVRDKNDGESPYRGNGFWHTDYSTSDGKTWVADKTETPILVLPPELAIGKGVMLECTASPAVSLLLQVFYDSKAVEIVGNDGKIAGVYQATVTDDFIAWGKTNISKPSFSATSVRLDRKTGALTTTVDYGTAPAGSCTKRSTEQKF